MNDQAKIIQDELFDVSQNILRGGSEVAPMAFLLVPKGEELVVHALPIYNFVDTKDEAAALIRREAAVRGARYVIHTSEGYIAGSDSGRDQAAAASILMSGGTLRDLPDHREVLVSNLDGPGVNRLLMCVIQEDGTLGETREVETDPAEAAGTRFGNLSGQAT